MTRNAVLWLRLDAPAQLSEVTDQITKDPRIGSATSQVVLSST